MACVTIVRNTSSCSIKQVSSILYELPSSANVFINVAVADLSILYSEQNVEEPSACPSTHSWADGCVKSFPGQPPRPLVEEEEAVAGSVCEVSYLLS